MCRVPEHGTPCTGFVMGFCLQHCCFSFTSAPCAEDTELWDWEIRCCELFLWLSLSSQVCWIVSCFEFIQGLSAYQRLFAGCRFLDSSFLEAGEGMAPKSGIHMYFSVWVCAATLQGMPFLLLKQRRKVLQGTSLAAFISAALSSKHISGE